MTILYSNSSPKYLNQVFLVPDLRIFSFEPTFATRQMQGHWFQIWQCFFQTRAEKYPNKAFLDPNLGVFIFFLKFCYQTNSRVLISNMILLFSNSSPKILESRIFVSKFKDFYFCTKLWNKANLTTSNMTIVFSNYSPKICKLGIFLPEVKDFYFANFAF